MVRGECTRYSLGNVAPTKGDDISSFRIQMHPGRAHDLAANVHSTYSCINVVPTRDDEISSFRTLKHPGRSCCFVANVWTEEIERVMETYRSKSGKCKKSNVKVVVGRQLQTENMRDSCFLGTFPFGAVGWLIL